MHDLALARIEVHFPSLFLLFEFYEGFKGPLFPKAVLKVL